MDATIECLNQRVSALEQQARAHTRTVRLLRLAVGFTALALVLVLTVAAAKQEPGVADASSPLLPMFLPLLQEGQPCTLPLAKTEGGGGEASKLSAPVLRVQEVQIATPTGQVVGVFGATDNRAALVMLNRFGTPVAAFAEDVDGTGLLRLYDSSGTLIASIGISTQGSGFIDLNRPNGERIAYAGATSEGGGIFFIRNSEGIRVAALGAHSQGKGYVDLKNTQGSRVAYLGSSTDGNGVYYAYDVDGNLTWTSSTASPSTPKPGLLGDLDDDRDVDFADFLIFAQQFGKKR